MGYLYEVTKGLSGENDKHINNIFATEIEQIWFLLTQLKKRIEKVEEENEELRKMVEVWTDIDKLLEEVD